MHQWPKQQMRVAFPSFRSGPEPALFLVIIFRSATYKLKKRPMSEYQYYEFRAVDRPLTTEQILELRRYSSRAEITATTFSVEYNWGDFKGDPRRWMEQYFDAFVHLANWGSRWLMLRIPNYVLNAEILSEYCGDDYLSFDIENKNLILSFRTDDEHGEWSDGGELLVVSHRFASRSHKRRSPVPVSRLVAIYSGVGL
jgi:hypothetical protein